MEEKLYRLAQYCIIEQVSGEIRWEAHGGLGSLKRGKCFVEGNILFIGPCNAEEAGLLKREFLEKVHQLPEWDKTKYYCARYSIHECISGNRDGQAVTIRAGKTEGQQQMSSVAPRKRIVDDIITRTQSHTARFQDIGQTIAKGFASIKSSFRRVRFRR